MARNGQCMCGAIRFRITAEVETAGACHCGMCRKWSGGVYLGIEVPPDGLHVEGSPTVFASSDWAERSFCGTCGSSLWYRVTAPGPHHGVYHVGMGCLGDVKGITLTEEIFIDRKPEGYAFAGDTKEMTEAEIFALFTSAEV